MTYYIKTATFYIFFCSVLIPDDVIPIEKKRMILDILRNQLELENS